VKRAWSSASVHSPVTKLVFFMGKRRFKDITIDVDAITEQVLMKHVDLYGVVLGLLEILNISILASFYIS
jgi:hypothetical protein